MNRRRVYAVFLVLAATFATATWLVTYRVSEVVQYIQYFGGDFHQPSERVRLTPWWSVPATVAVLLAGNGLSLWLLAGSSGLIKRLADHFAKLAQRDRDGRANGAAD